MIKYLKGDLLSSSADALVNTVNTVGVMGKGIALQFKNRFPKNYKVYKEACKNKAFKTGDVLVVQDGDLLHHKLIINFPTKGHWKGNSKYEYISTGLVALKQAINQYKISSIAIPPLGCGNGGLEWNKVKAMIEDALSDLDVDIEVYTPNEAIKEILQQQTIKKEVKLTNARAMLLYLMFHYEANGEQSSLFVANKMAYFLQRSGEAMRLKFAPHHYGPYAVQVNHVLLALNGAYLKGLEQNIAKPFEPIHLNYERFSEVQSFIEAQLNFEQKNRLKSVKKLLSGFESTFSVELLSTVDYIMHNENTKKLEEVENAISKWSQRKKNSFQTNHIQIAMTHLKEHTENTFEMA